MKGRSIAKIGLMAYEITSDIKKRDEQPNVVVKLDMKKVYDRVS